jgi:Siphovirus Gp157
MIHPDIIKFQIASLLHAHPQLREDEEAPVLSLESETDATSVCAQLVKRVKEIEAHSEGVATYIRELKCRQDLLDLRAENLRTALLKIMETAGLKTLPLPIATLSVRYIPHVDIVERDLVPEQYRRHPPWEPKKAEIKERLKAGEHVSGCALSSSEPSLTIRTR